jgi:hypothetical protein
VEAACTPRSVTLLTIGRLPKELLPIANLRLHVSDAVEKCREVVA